MGCGAEGGAQGINGGKAGLLRDMGLLVEGLRGAVERMSVRA